MRIGLWMKVQAAAMVLVLGGILTPTAATAETLAATLASAYEHNGLIDQNRALLRAADEDVAQALSALLPIINWSGGVTHSRGRSFTPAPFAAPRGSYKTSATVGIVGELLLYDFGRTGYQVDAAKEAVLATRQSLVSAEQQVLLRAAAAFFEIRRQNEFVNLRNNNVRVIAEELRAARDRFEVGEVTRTDVSLAEARLAAARSAQAAAQGSLARAVEEYRAAVGRKPGRMGPAPRVPATARSLEEAKAIAVRNHPEMLKVQHEVAASELAILAAEAAMKPTIKLRGGASIEQNFGNTGFVNGANIGIEAEGPIYQGGRLSSIARKAMAQRDLTRAGLHVVRHAVAQNVGNAWAQLQVARASRDAGDQQVRAARVAFRGVREEATLGARTTLDVLDAEQELLDAQANLISSMIDEHVAAYQLLSSMGWLTAERLKLNVPAYDPAAYYNMVKDAPAIHSKQGQKLDKVLRALGKE